MDVLPSRETRKLYKALMRGEEKKDEVLRLLRSCASSDTEAEQHRLTLTTLNDTVLHIAIYFGHESLAQCILDNDLVHPDVVKKANALGDTILHEAATTNMTNVAVTIINKAEELLTKRNKYGESPLFRAAHYGQTNMFSTLVRQINLHRCQEPLLRREDGTTALHIAILAEFFDTALEIVKLYPDLAGARDERGSTGLHLLSSIPSAFKSGSDLGLFKRFIYYCVPSGDTSVPHDSSALDGASDISDTDEDTDGSRRSPMLPPIYRICMEIYSIISRPIASVLQKINKTIWETYITNKGWPMMERIWKEKKKHESALRLAKFLARKDTSWEHTNSGGRDEISITLDIPMKRLKRKFKKKKTGNPIDDDEDDDDEVENQDNQKFSGPGGGIASMGGEDGYSNETPLLLASRSGIVEIVKAILEVYPQAVEHVSVSAHNVLHVAVKYRQKEVFDLVKSMDIPMRRLKRKIDIKGNTILHQVAFMAMRENIRGKKPGPALQLQDELLWFKHVESVLPPHYTMHRNKKGLTAEELFNKSVEELLKDAGSWLKRTSESCSLVAVLIATVAFAAAYTIPGGSDEHTGLPVLLNKPFFLVFTVMDVISLASSLTSVVMFLSILTSPFQLQDFHQSLPRRLTLALTFLFMSVATMMLAFAATIILTIHMNAKWATTLIYAVAFLPVTIFALLQFPLYIALVATIKDSLEIVQKALPRCPNRKNE